MTGLHIFIILMGLGSISAVLGSAKLLKYYALQHNDIPGDAASFGVQASVVTQYLAILLIACSAGTLANQSLSLELAPVLTEVIVNDVHPHDVWLAIKPAIVTGVHAGIGFSLFFIFVYPYLIPQGLTNILTQTRSCQGILPRLLFEGVFTEIIIRWGLVASIYGLLDLIFGPITFIQLISVGLAAFLHASSKLPNLYALYRKACSRDLIIVGVVNFALGCMFGWLFIQHGIISVMLAHMCYEVISILVDGYQPDWDA